MRAQPRHSKVQLRTKTDGSKYEDLYVRVYETIWPGVAIIQVGDDLRVTRKYEKGIADEWLPKNWILA
jgi:hypothetical protein